MKKTRTKKIKLPSFPKKLQQVADAAAEAFKGEVQGWVEDIGEEFCLSINLMHYSSPTGRQSKKAGFAFYADLEDNFGSGTYASATVDQDSICDEAFRWLSPRAVENSIGEDEIRHLRAFADALEEQAKKIRERLDGMTVI